MQVDQHHPISDDLVLQRTSAGQRALVFDAAENPADLRLLGMLTGHTPLGTFMRLGVDQEVARTAAQRLVATNLAVKASRPTSAA